MQTRGSPLDLRPGKPQAASGVAAVHPTSKMLRVCIAIPCDLPGGRSSLSVCVLGPPPEV